MMNSTEKEFLVSADARPAEPDPVTQAATDNTLSDGRHTSHINTNGSTTDGNDARYTDSGTVDTSESTCERYTSCRWTLAYMASFMTLLAMCLRYCISMAIVCIGNVRYVEEVSVNGSLGGSCQEVYNLSMGEEDALVEGMGENGSNMHWNRTTVVCTANYIPSDMQGVVLSSYYYGYIVTSFFGGMIAERYGAKRVLSINMAVAAVSTLLTPLAIRFNVYLTVAFRVLLGLVSGFCVPGITTMWAYWAPAKEKAKLLALTFSGSSTGSIMANLVSGFLCSIPLDEGWPFIFYIYGALTFLWVILWHFLVYDTPEQHPRIQDKERVLLQRNGASNPNSRKVSNPPMKSIFTSPAFLSLLITHISYGWFLGTISTYLPIYLNDVFLFDIQTNGVMSSLPFIFGVVAMIVFAVISDRLTTGGKLTVAQSRKVFQSIGLLVPSVILLVVGFLNPDLKYLAVVLMIVVASFLSACMSGFRLNHLDIAPRFAGSLAGITSTFSTVSNILNPLIVSPMVADKRQESWRNVFIITAALSLVGTLAFAIFGRGDEQDWAKPKLLSPKPTSGVTTSQNGGTSSEAGHRNYGSTARWKEGKLNFSFSVEEDEDNDRRQRKNSQQLVYDKETG